MVSMDKTYELLKNASNEELQPIVEYILKASISEQLSKTENYKKYSPNHTRYVDEIFHELRLFGGNTLVNLKRGEGPRYKELVQDVAKRFGVKKVTSYDLEELELALAQAVLLKAYKKGSAQDKQSIEEALLDAGMNEGMFSSFINGTGWAGLASAAVFNTVMLQATSLLASSVSMRMMGYAAASFIGQRATLSFLGPIGLVAGAAYTANGVAGPGFRVTTPCVLHITWLRQKKKYTAMHEKAEEVFVND
mgnify:CR=1 FL=1|tara:strand:- start:13453 stop:14202 length:750 start_codon:yes stop_codon:yes gene_type:complete